jgi:two-component system cell cycle sensor histidine kinase/response regulator CckA
VCYTFAIEKKGNANFRSFVHDAAKGGMYEFPQVHAKRVLEDSRRGHGTTFTLLLPEHVGGAPANAPAAADAPPAARGAQGRVLVVEDRDDVRANVVRTLATHGFDVDEASDGDGALALLAQGCYAAMCIDGVMPGLRTADVIERAAELAPGMGVLVCSGYVREDLLRRGIHAGRYAFLAKPFTADQLIASVDGVLRTAAALRIDR